MTEKEIVLETIRELPDNCWMEEIADRIEIIAAVQKGVDQLDRGKVFLTKKSRNNWPHGLQADLVPGRARRICMISSSSSRVIILSVQ
jgi:hypothetical protein